MKSCSIARVRAAAALAFAAVLLASCGGGGGNPGTCLSGSAETCQSSSTPAPSPAPASASAQWANMCTLEGEKQFTRSYLEEVYLWYREIQPVDAAGYTDLGVYFHDLLTKALDATGRLKDRFSFVVSNADANSITTGSNIGYGLRLDNDRSGRMRVAFVDAGSPADAAGLQRGGELVRMLTDGPIDWFPNAAAEISFEYRATPDAPIRTVTLRSAAVQEDPLPLASAVASPAGTQVAYLLFNAHTLGAQDKLIRALSGVQAAGVHEVVLDMRYNQGGFLYTALGLSSMLAGPDADGKVFERLQFNDKRQDLTNSQTFRFSGLVQQGETDFPVGTSLPRLALPRVYVLATGSTCSASESVINSLRGVGVEVVLVGEPTCGKPYGFSRKDNCGLSYFPIEFQGVNDKGFGDYAAGFAPTCPAADDFDHALGTPSEGLLATALHHIDSGSCGPATAQAQVLRMESPRSGTLMLRHPGKLIAPAGTR